MPVNLDVSAASAAFANALDQLGGKEALTTDKQLEHVNALITGLGTKGLAVSAEQRVKAAAIVIKFKAGRLPRQASAPALDVLGTGNKTKQLNKRVSELESRLAKLPSAKSNAGLTALVAEVSKQSADNKITRADSQRILSLFTRSTIASFHHGNKAQRALIDAAKNGNADLVKALFLSGQFGDSIQTAGGKALLEAIKSKKPGTNEVVAALIGLPGGVDPKQPVGNTTALFEAHRAGRMDLVQQIRACPNNPVAVHPSAEPTRGHLLAAAQRGALSVDDHGKLEIRDQNGVRSCAGFSQKDLSDAFVAAAQEGHLDAISGLNFADANLLKAAGPRALVEAAKNGQIRVFNFLGPQLQNAGISLDKIIDGTTALAEAVKQEASTEMVGSLLKAGANPGTRLSDHATAVHLAAQQGKAPSLTQMMRRLDEMDAQAKPPHVGKSNKLWKILNSRSAWDFRPEAPTPLTLAVRGGHKDAVKALLECPATLVNQRSKAHDTPFTEALRSSTGRDCALLMLQTVPLSKDWHCKSLSQYVTDHSDPVGISFSSSYGIVFQETSESGKYLTRFDTRFDFDPYTQWPTEYCLDLTDIIANADKLPPPSQVALIEIFQPDSRVKVYTQILPRDAKKQADNLKPAWLGLLRCARNVTAHTDAHTNTRAIAMWENHVEPRLQKLLPEEFPSDSDS